MHPGASAKTFGADFFSRPFFIQQEVFWAMQLHLATAEGNWIGEAGEGFVVIGGVRRAEGVIVLPERLVEWPAASASEVCMARLRVAAELEPPPEVVLLGTSRQAAAPNPEWAALFAARGVGLEVMTMDAACRTYNILAADGRQVAAALTLASSSS